MDIIGVNLIPDIESEETTNIGVCLIPHGQLPRLTLKDLKNNIRNDVLACPKTFNFCTEQRWVISEDQELKLPASQILINNNQILIKASHDGPKCGIKNRHGNVIGFVHIEYNAKLVLLKNLINQQILNCETSSHSIQFLDGNHWPISRFQEDHMTISDILIGRCVCIDVQEKRRLSSDQFTPPKEPPAKKLKSKELSFRSGKDVCRQLSSDCTDGDSTAKQILISYVRSEAADHALKLKQQLLSHGLSVYLDVHEIQTGVDWQDSLNFAVSGCEVFVPLVTMKYGETQWTNREVKLADVLGKYILPVSFLHDWPPRCLAIQFATTQYIPWKTIDPAANPDSTYNITDWSEDNIKLVARKISDRITGLGVTSVPSLIKRSTIVKSCALVTEDNMLAVTSNRDGKPLVMICVHPAQESYGYELQQILESEDYEVWCTTQLDREHVDHIDGLANSQDDITYSVLTNGCSVSMAAGCHDDSILQNIQLFQEKADDASVVLFILSENFSGSRVCQQQVFYCEHRKRVVPILYEDFQMPQWMTMLVGSHGFEMRTDEDFLKILFRRVKAALVPNLSWSSAGISPIKLSPSPVGKKALTKPISSSKVSVVQQNSGKFVPSDHSDSQNFNDESSQDARPGYSLMKEIALTGKSSQIVTGTSKTDSNIKETSPSAKNSDVKPSLSKMKTVILAPDNTTST